MRPVWHRERTEHSAAHGATAGASAIVALCRVRSSPRSSCSGSSSHASLAGFEQSDCGRSLVCRDERCVPLAAPGERCEESRDCYPGLACVQGRCARTAACHAGELGDPCMTESQCKRSLRCDGVQRRCVAAPKLGDACSSDLACGSGLSCVGISNEGGTCQHSERRANGEACEWFWECASEFCDDGRCGKPVACEPP